MRAKLKLVQPNTLLITTPVLPQIAGAVFHLGCVFIV